MFVFFAGVAVAGFVSACFWSGADIGLSINGDVFGFVPQGGFHGAILEFLIGAVGFQLLQSFVKGAFGAGSRIGFAGAVSNHPGGRRLVEDWDAGTGRRDNGPSRSVNTPSARPPNSSRTSRRYHARCNRQSR